MAVRDDLVRVVGALLRQLDSAQPSHSESGGTQSGAWLWHCRFRSDAVEQRPDASHSLRVAQLLRVIVVVIGEVVLEHVRDAIPVEPGPTYEFLNAS